MHAYAALVLAGGAGRRMGDPAKPLLPVGGVPMLRRVLDAVPAARPLIVVGPPELAAELPAGAVLTREDPPGGGPVAAVAAGAAHLPHDGLVLVTAADLPFLTPTAVATLASRLGPSGAKDPQTLGPIGADDGDVGRADVALFVDEGGRAQHLCAMWRIPALRAALPARPHGASMRGLLDGVAVARVRWTGGGPPPWYDCDTPDELRRAETAGERADQTSPVRGGEERAEERP
jgi:molybdopterin-guanine dinucleotide biosynthesis protein A